MSGIEVVMLMSLIVNVIAVILIVTIGKELLTQKFMMSQLHTATTNLVSRIMEQNTYMQKMGNTLAELLNSIGDMMEQMQDQQEQGVHNVGMVYRTLDGKYSAQSLQELISKIQKDGKEQNYLSEDELDNLRQMFEDDDEDEE